MSELLVLRLTDQAIFPTRLSNNSAGFNIASAKSYVIPKYGRALVETHLEIKVPAGFGVKIAPRNCPAVNRGVLVGPSILDEDLVGELKVLFNFSSRDFIIHPGDKIARLICLKLEYPEIKEVHGNLGSPQPT